MATSPLNDPKSPTKVKPWERQDHADSSASVANPNLVILRSTPGWSPRRYVSYLWLLVDADDLRVGIETQASIQDASRTSGDPTAKHYGHPTLASGSDALKALYGGELLYTQQHGWIINKYSGRYGAKNRTWEVGEEFLKHVKTLFWKYAQLEVSISEYKVTK